MFEPLNSAEFCVGVPVSLTNTNLCLYHLSSMQVPVVIQDMAASTGAPELAKFEKIARWAEVPRRNFYPWVNQIPSHKSHTVTAIYQLYSQL